MTKTETAFRIECVCPICADNATKLGRTVLAAEITHAGIAKLGGYLSAETRHTVVYNANHPQIGRALRAHHSAYWAVP